METMIDVGTSETEKVLARFRQGQLTEQDLRAALERRGPAGKLQDLLYLQATNASVTAGVLGMSMVRDGEMVDWPAGADWPYASVLAAIRDGWRVIKFPELAMLLVDERTIGLGCEFVLEKWG
jgi:hypothetical protein